METIRAHHDAMLMETFGLSTSTIAPEQPPMTATMLLAQMRELEALPPIPRIVFDLNVLADSDERTFPASRHRSARIHKKLVKRFGGEFRKQPVMWKIGNVIYAHPIFRKELERATPVSGVLS